MSDSAYKDTSDLPDDDFDQELVGQEAAHDEFISEIGQVMELPDVDVDGYVDNQGHPQPHQSPAEVEAERDRQAEIDAHVHEIPMRDDPLERVDDLDRK